MTNTDHREAWSHFVAVGAACGLLAGVIDDTVYGLTAVWHYFDPRYSSYHLYLAPLLDLVAGSTLGLLLWLAGRLFRPLSRPPLWTFILLWGMTFFPTMFTAWYFGLSRAAWAAAAMAVAWRLAAPLAEWSPAVFRLMRRMALPLLAGLLLWAVSDVMLGAWRQRALEAALPAAATPRPANVVLITLDTVRADHLSPYGYARPTSPSLSTFAARGVLFRQAMAPSSWTKPSHASMLTGRYPLELFQDSRRLDEVPTLAAVLSARGYRCGGFVANAVLNRTHGFSRGFSHYDDAPVSPRDLLLSPSFVYFPTLYSVGSEEAVGRVAAPCINQAFLRWQAEDAQQRPFFAFLNYMDAHFPYVPPPHEQRYVPPAVDLRSCFAVYKPEDLGPASQRYVTDAYDSCISYLDEQVHILLDEMARRHLLENTVVIITSDHGEHLGERHHGNVIFDHGNTLYPELVEVPLIMAGPGIPEHTAINEPVSLRDVAATVLALSGSPSGSLPGSSLTACWTSPAASSQPAPVYAELEQIKPVKRNAPLVVLRSVRLGPLYYIRNEATGGDDLYDLGVDPGALNDISEDARYAVQYKQMQALMKRWARRQTTVSPTPGG
jgi:arylsulfatase A-like enzyme